jgi:uncharacterized protein HemX
VRHERIYFIGMLFVALVLLATVGADWALAFAALGVAFWRFHTIGTENLREQLDVAQKQAQAYREMFRNEQNETSRLTGLLYKYRRYAENRN